MQYIIRQCCASITKYCDKTVALWQNCGVVTQQDGQIGWQNKNARLPYLQDLARVGALMIVVKMWLWQV